MYTDREELPILEIDVVKQHIGQWWQQTGDCSLNYASVPLSVYIKDANA